MRLHPIQLFLLCIFLINSSLVSGLCLSNQSSLLLKLKGGFKTLNSKISSWTGGSDCCSWIGVTCDNKTGLVIGLDLSSATRPEWITGMIDESLFQLNSLQSLNLSYNNFSSSIPPGLQNLSSLIHLNLSNAGFIGQIPLQISQMTWLVSLDLSTSSYLNSGTTVLKLEDPDLKTLLQKLTALQELRLDGINMSMAGTEWSQVVSSSLHDLRVLSLSNCFLSGPIDVSLLQLPFLSELHLDGNNLSSLTSESFSDFSSINLTFLNLRSCKLSGKLPENIFWLPYLHTLDISNNPLTGSLPSFPTNSSLQFLLLSRTNLGGSLPETTGNLKFLKKLDLNTCNFSGHIPSSLKTLTQLLILDLSSNNFTGQIPLLASRVQIIDLNQNQLSGAIPSSYGELLSLTKLNLKNNKLSGTFPPSLLALPLLQNLDLSQNQLRGSIQSSMINATELETLDLSYNMLSGSIPRSITNLTQLKILVLSYNNFSGTIDFELFQNLKNLSNLDLSGNSLTVEFNKPSVTGLLQITTLKLASCNINDFPLSFQGQDQGQTTLSYLDLSNNKLKGEIPSWIWRAGNGTLFHLNLSHNFLTRVGDPINISSSSLSVLDLHDNMLEGTLPFPPYAIVLDYSKNRFASTIPGNIGQSLFYTIYLSLSNNNFTGGIPAAICNASYLSVLDMSHNSFNGSIPECLPKISSSLSVLNLQGNNLQGIIPDRFSNSRKLRTLNLNSNQLIGSIPKSLRNCSMLEVLDLGNNHLNSTFPSWLENLPQLQVLVLRSNEFQGEIDQAESQRGFPALKIIDVSSNRFTGSLPTRFFKNWKSMTIDGEDKSVHQSDYFLRFRVLEFTSLYYQDAVTVSTKGQEMQFLKVLTIFTAIDFSNNRFSGRIPEELGSLNYLIVLNMSRNSLRGKIPTTLGNLSSLESMDLSHNSLSGQIPSELTQLNFLSVLDLSNNQLNGGIPTGTQFSTFPNTSFEGNRGLCGPPLLLQCTATAPAPASTDGEAKIPNREQGIDWHFILVGVGFGGGMGVALGILMFWKKGRRWYNGHMDKMLALLLPVPGQIYHSCRVDAEEKVQDLTRLYTDDEGEEEVEEEVVFKRRFCLFCTKLDVGGTRVIHRTCSCVLDSETSTVSSFSIQS